ncbi:uncharacterized protein [Battus philenor]|uniref:uncharacterized protein n=1 Tax=Battus philenor TaxID=42288 RepID=UPI0035CFF566
MSQPSNDDRKIAEVLRVGVRVPPFWPEEPALWFSQLECQFSLSGISADETKFNYLVAQLDHQVAVEVKDLIIRPPDREKYEKLKTELIRRLSASQEKRVKQLLMFEELGDRKPSRFLRYLEDLAGPSVPSHIVKSIWSNGLPQNIQTVIASQTDLSLEKLGELADKVYEIAPTTPQISMATTSSGSASSSTLEELTRQVSELTRQVAALTSRNGRNSARSESKYERNRFRSRSTPRQPPPDHPYCFYHYTYDSKAIKCRQPCTFQAGNEQGGRK